MSDLVVQLQHATQSLGIAYNAYQGSSFCKIFAVKIDLAGLAPEQIQQRQLLLRLLGQLIDTEFGEQMDKLCTAWIAYRKSSNPGGV
jgi:hypothetical protein